MAVSVVALCMTACERENGGSGGNHGYPATANVIRNAVKDIDGNKYDAVQIGDQVWMAENLKTTRFADGTSILLEETYNAETPCRYAPGLGGSNEENMVNVERYGYLYNWTAVMHGASSSDANPSGVQGICPDGWHVPSFAEWTELINYMKTQPAYIAGGNSKHLAKALATTWGWKSCDEEDAPGNDPTTNNATGFSACPAGCCYGYHNEFFGEDANFWSSTETDWTYACGRALCYDEANVDGGGYGLKGNGQSVRCIRD